ncbi:Ammonia transport outward protein 2 [Zancudomyces culisetae]|uniref:Ammonia transport outward protein 2 n=1 Tax=Zancudomyces culisetae TaxID=1213189 RepID=A0A1R1PX52_ZANCU|nr:Ammonia transport outward protein 2 [Zancudomyces culisetae]OMH81340.1 Ammonia transport outward protein 2 [Zancudomyces culisetae]OMH83340.1 Ammonia transport outward protein 2 [Zancudomyces culisetae]OMH85560.1 Ammonia transport outward protein 2 [Zancudomyces culisetae]|eukprot:OMH78734.1 Ammonia transport outward protein 2 [Zancudomyces culisetae]
MVKLADPSAIGLCGFALTTLVLSMHNAGIGIPYGSPNNVVVGLAFFYGGFAQFTAGVFDILHNNMFGGTAFISYGAFWMSFASILTPGFGVKAAFTAANSKHLPNALGIFLLGWTIFTFIMMIASYRIHFVMATLFTFLFVTFVLLTIGEWKASKVFMTLGGSFGFVTALIAFYLAASLLISKKSGFSFDLPNKSLAAPKEPVYDSEA